MKINRPLITVASFSALGLNGMAFTFMGVSLPSLQADLEISIEQTGALMASFQAGFTLFTLLGGIFSDYFYREWVLALGCTLLCIGSLSLCFLSSLMASMLAVSLMGAGIGFILSGSNTLLVDLYPHSKGTILNIHHVFFGIGAILGPVLMGVFIAHDGYWQGGFYSLALVLVILGFIFSFSKGKKSISKDGALSISALRKLIGDEKFQVIMVVNFLTMGSQVAIMLFGAIFLIQAKQCTLAQASGALSIFSVFMVVGRVLCGRAALTIKHSTIIVFLLWLQMVTLLFAWQGNGWTAMVFIALSGLTFSGTYPTLLALTSILSPRHEGTALGILSTMGGLGSVILCWLTGYVAGLTNLEFGFIVVYLGCFSALVLFQVNHRSLCLRETVQD